MNPMLSRLSSSLRLSSRAISPPTPAMSPATYQWTRGIRVEVRNGNLDQALALMERKMRSSGMERLIRRQVNHHIKNSEKRVLARKNLQLRVRSQELARKLRAIVVKKIRGL